VFIMLMGPPGSGKGTQAIRIASRYRVPHISTGDALRAAVKAGTPIGREVKETMEAGRLVGDGLITALVRERLGQPDASGGCILDGFPRTPAQAETLETIVDASTLIVVHLAAADEEIVRRLSTRRVCDACAITQSVSHDADPERGACPYCGGNLVRRADDHPDTIRRRLETYAALAAPLLAYYAGRPTFGTVDGLQTLDRVTAALCAHIDRASGRAT
jgi:adenylate kinase